MVVNLDLLVLFWFLIVCVGDCGIGGKVQSRDVVRPCATHDNDGDELTGSKMNSVRR